MVYHISILLIEHRSCYKANLQTQTSAKQPDIEMETNTRNGENNMKNT